MKKLNSLVDWLTLLGEQMTAPFYWVGAKLTPGRKFAMVVEAFRTGGFSIFRND